ncbi:MAG: transcription elongation factor 1 family protein [Candidatus Thorarchaeota archaeon]
MIKIGRRKRKQVAPKRVKRVPKIFTCPECGEKSVKVTDIKKKGAFATVKCGNCELEKEVLVNSISEPVDAFGDFIDIYYADQELQRLEKRIQKLKLDNEWGELALSYSILSDLCKTKAAVLLEEDDVDLDEVNDWKTKAEEFKRLEKDALLKLDSEELDRGVRTDEESLFAESETRIKKERKIDDIFDDPGFLEF